MEKNTVLVSLDEYLELKNFKEEAIKARNESKFVAVYSTEIIPYGLSFSTRSYVKYYTESDIFSQIEKYNKELSDKNIELLETKNELAFEMAEIKRMNIWNLIKWWYTNTKNE